MTNKKYYWGVTCSVMLQAELIVFACGSYTLAMGPLCVMYFIFPSNVKGEVDPSSR